MDTYVVKVVHTTPDGRRHEGFHGPYTLLTSAWNAAEWLTLRYSAEPMRLDGTPCSSRVSVEPLMPPLRLVARL